MKDTNTTPTKESAALSIALIIAGTILGISVLALIGVLVIVGKVSIGELPIAAIVTGVGTGVGLLLTYLNTQDTKREAKAAKEEARAAKIASDKLAEESGKLHQTINSNMSSYIEASNLLAAARATMKEQADQRNREAAILASSNTTSTTTTTSTTDSPATVIVPNVEQPTQEDVSHRAIAGLGGMTTNGSAQKKLDASFPEQKAIADQPPSAPAPSETQTKADAPPPVDNVGSIVAATASNTAAIAELQRVAIVQASSDPVPVRIVQPDDSPVTVKIAEESEQEVSSDKGKEQKIGK